LTLIHKLNPSLLPPASEPITFIPLRCVVLSHKHQRAAARIAEENVVYDYRAHQKAELEPWMEKVIRTAAADEEQSMRVWAERRAVVETWLDELERRSWRSGRPEDNGPNTPTAIREKATAM